MKTHSRALSPADIHTHTHTHTHTNTHTHANTHTHNRTVKIAEDGDFLVLYYNDPPWTARNFSSERRKKVL